MGSEWRTVPIGSLCEAVFDGPHATPKKTTAGPVFLGISSLNSGRLDLEKSQRLSESDFRKWTRRVTPCPGDVVFSYETRLGEAASIPEGLKCCLGRRLALMRPDRSKVDPRFLLYAYLGPNFQQTIRERTVQGSTVERILLTEFPDYPVEVPCLAEQRRIAHILGTLDDKIESNRRTNETLEAMARSLFKSWFVDFDPVRAKAAGRQPDGMDADTAALFPDSFEESELGEIPKGWSVARLGDVLELKRGYDLPARARRAGTVPIVSSSGRSGWHDQAKAKAPGVVTGRYGTIGQVFLVSEDFWPLNTTLYVRDCKGNRLLHCYYLLSHLDFGKFSDKAAVPGVNRNHVHGELVAAAPVVLQEHFDALAGHWVNGAAHFHAQTDVLAGLRDTLLPRLLSGELAVKRAERAMEATV